MPHLSPKHPLLGTHVSELAAATAGMPPGKVPDVLQLRIELGPPERSHTSVFISRMIRSIFLPASQVHTVPKHQIPHTDFVFGLPPSSFYRSQSDHRMKIFHFFFFFPLCKAKSWDMSETASAPSAGTKSTRYTVSEEKGIIFIGSQYGGTKI